MNSDLIVIVVLHFFPVSSRRMVVVVLSTLTDPLRHWTCLRRQTSTQRRLYTALLMSNWERIRCPTSSISQVSLSVDRW